MQRIYLDYAATTPVDPAVLAKMLPYYTEYYENPSALYSQRIKYDIENARGQIAAAIAAAPGEIIFTSGGTEANNLAILGTGRQFKQAHFITTAIEHDSVLQAFAQLEKEGHTVSYLPVAKDGRISLTDLENAICPETKLISVMTVNNEIGTLQDIAAVSAIARRHGILFHTDAVQAMEQTEVSAQNVDMISLSAHKLYGPKGIGALYVRKGIRLQPLLLGGQQESGRRGGTENVAAVIGFGAAIKACLDEKETRRQHRQELMSFLLTELSAWEEIEINGSVEHRSSGICHLSIPGVSTEALLTMLDLNGVSISAGSACQAGSYRISHVMKALGEPEGRAHLRISLGKNTTVEELSRFLAILRDLIKKLRS